MGNYININGKLLTGDAAVVPCDNRAFRYGYGLFETMLYADGRIILADYHWKRLFAGMSQLYFEIPKLWKKSFFEAAIERTVLKNKLEALCRVRLQVYPGSGGLYDLQDQQPRFLIECFPLEKDITRLNENGWQVGMAAGIYKSADALSNLKSCNALIYAIAAQQAKANRWNDALICNTDGRVIESTIANIFWVKEETIYTPPLSEGCVAGVMRQFLLDFLPTQSIQISTTLLTEEILLQADEVFLTNSIRNIKWIGRFGEKTYGHSMAATVQQMLPKIYP